MKHWMLIAALACFGSSHLRAQDVPAPAPVAAPAVLAPEDWTKLGSAFGSRDQWQFGFDKSATLGSCAAYAVRAQFLMAGPCRDVLILAKDKVPTFHLGAAALYSASHTPGYVGRLGFNVGPATKALLEYTAEKIPYVEAVTELRAPAALAYLGKITTLDYMAGVVGDEFDHGPQLKMDIPLADIRTLLPGF